MCPSPDSGASGDGAAEVSVVVNGESLRMPAASAVTDLLERLGLAGRPLAVEINRTVVPDVCSVSGCLLMATSWRS